MSSGSRRSRCRALGLILSLRRRRDIGVLSAVDRVPRQSARSRGARRPGASNGHRPPADRGGIRPRVLLRPGDMAGARGHRARRERQRRTAALRGEPRCPHRGWSRRSPPRSSRGSLLVPSILGHWSVAHRAGKPYADRLASAVFAELPPRSGGVRVELGARGSARLPAGREHRRRDVLVVDMYAAHVPVVPRGCSSAGSVRPLPPRLGDSVLDARRAAKWLSSSRPVYMDLHGAQVLSGVDTSEDRCPGT